MADEALRGYRYDQRFVPLSAERLGDGLADQQFVSSIIPESGIAVPVSKDDAAVLVKRADDPWTPVAAISADHRAAWLARDGSFALGRPMRLYAEDSAHKVNECRSEEHTSELQSLMRISSAVFCLINNKTKMR